MSMNNTVEQDARDLLGRMNVANAQDYSAGELVELSNIIATARGMAKLLRSARGCVEKAVMEEESEGYTHDDECDSLLQRIDALLKMADENEVTRQPSPEAE